VEAAFDRIAVNRIRTAAVLSDRNVQMTAAIARSRQPLLSTGGQCNLLPPETTGKLNIDTGRVARATLLPSAHD